MNFVKKHQLRIFLQFALFFAVFYGVVIAQAPSFQWALSAGSPGDDLAFDVTTDIENNIIITGGFEETTDFGGTSLTSGGGRDPFIAKYNPAGNLLWAVQGSGISNDGANGVAIDLEGNVIISGSFQGTLSFNDISLTSSGGQDIFLAKYDANGAFQWVRSASSNRGVVGWGVAVDSQNNIVFTGTMRDTTRFGDVSLTSANGSRDIYIAKYAPNGDLLWVEQAGSAEGEGGLRVAVDTDDNILAMGSLGAISQFDDITVMAQSSTDVFLAKYDSDGNAIWAKSIGGNNGLDLSGDLITDGDNNVYLTGPFQGTANFDGNPITSAGDHDVYIAKYDSDGNFQWVRQGGSPGLDLASGIALDSSGTVYITGRFGGTANFSGTEITTVSTQNLFLAKYSPDGELIQVVGAGGPTLVKTFSLAIDRENNGIATGSFEGRAVFGETSVSSSGGDDIFIAKFGPF